MMMTVVVVEVKMKRLVAMLNHGDAGGGVESAGDGGDMDDKMMLMTVVVVAEVVSPHALHPLPRPLLLCADASSLIPEPIPCIVTMLFLDAALMELEALLGRRGWCSLWS